MHKKYLLWFRGGLVSGFCAGLLFLTGCQSVPTQQAASPVPAVKPLPIPVASHEFSFDPARDDVVGSVQVITAGKDDTLSDIARRFNLGYEEIVSANPGIDPWLPKAGTRIVIPTQFVLPDAPRQGWVEISHLGDVGFALADRYQPLRRRGELAQLLVQLSQPFAFRHHHHDAAAHEARP